MEIEVTPRAFVILYLFVSKMLITEFEITTLFEC
jgi:hypothetical protein